jgi:hypothetical protein
MIGAMHSSRMLFLAGVTSKRTPFFMINFYSRVSNLKLSYPYFGFQGFITAPGKCRSGLVM